MLLIKRDGKKKWVGAGGRVTKGDIDGRAQALEHDGDLLLRIGNAGRKLLGKNCFAEDSILDGRPDFGHI